MHKMSLLCNGKPIGGLPDPRGSLSSARVLHAIAEAKVQNVTLLNCGVSFPDCLE